MEFLMETHNASSNRRAYHGSRVELDTLFGLKFLAREYTAIRFISHWMQCELIILVTCWIGLL